MKTLIITAFYAILAIILSSSCQKNPVPPSPPVTYSVNIVITGNGKVVADKTSGIALGSSVTLKFTPEIGSSFYSIKVNGTKRVDVQPSATELFYTIQNVNYNLIVEVVFVETQVLLLSKLEPAWVWTKLDIHRADDNAFLYSVELTEAEKSRKMYHYYPSMEIKYINPDGSLYWNATWDLKQDVYKQGGQILTVIELTSDKFIHKAPPIWSNINNCYVYAKYTYERK